MIAAGLDESAAQSIGNLYISRDDGIYQARNT